jgi:hypothetical protein
VAGTPTVQDALTLLDGGWIPDYFAAAELEVQAQLALTTDRKRTIDAGGGISLGPVQLQGRLAETFSRGETANLQVRCTLQRKARSRALSEATEALASQ